MLQTAIAIPIGEDGEARGIDVAVLLGDEGEVDAGEELSPLSLIS